MKRLITILSITFTLIYCEKSYSNYYLGPYISVAVGQMAHTQSSIREVYDNYIFGGGGIFQTSIYRRGLYNYRLNFCFEKIYIPHTTKLGTDFRNTIRGNLINTIAYSIYKKRNYNLWIGPQIGLHILWGDNYLSDNKYNKLNTILISSIIMNPELPLIILLYSSNNYVKFTDFIFSFAPEIGIDINATDFLIVSLESGLRVGIHLPTNKISSSVTLYRFEGFFNLSFLFRINKEENT